MEYCSGFGFGYFDNVSNEWICCDVNCLCYHCKRFNKDVNNRLTDFIGWHDSTDHCEFLINK